MLISLLKSCCDFHCGSWTSFRSDVWLPFLLKLSIIYLPLSDILSPKSNFHIRNVFSTCVQIFYFSRFYITVHFRSKSLILKLIFCIKLNHPTSSDYSLSFDNVRNLNGNGGPLLSDGMSVFYPGPADMPSSISSQWSIWAPLNAGRILPLSPYFAWFPFLSLCRTLPMTFL